MDMHPQDPTIRSGSLDALLLTLVLAAPPIGGCGEGPPASATGAFGGGGEGSTGSDGGTSMGGAAAPDARGGGGDDGGGDGGGGDGGGSARSDCPADMTLVSGGGSGADTCMDRYEAPNHAGALPLVMYSKLDGEAWCAARGKRLCTDDEWTRACGGDGGLDYPYGDEHAAGVCNDDDPWLVYDQSALNLWPPSASGPFIDSFEELLATARSVSAGAALAADHVEALYQAVPSGESAGCVGARGVFDLTGNIEEWTRRADGGDGDLFTGSLKGRYWAEPKTCADAVTTHADPFRFYETGFRCCAAPLGAPP
jgi:hypothetical protein